MRPIRSFLLSAILAATIACAANDTAYLERYEKARAAWLARDKAGALELLAELQKSHPGRPEANLLAGKIHFFDGNFSLARERFETAASGNSLDAWKWLARSLVMQKEHARAWDVLKKAVAASAEDIELLLLMGRLQEEQGNLALALELYARVLAGRNFVAEAAINLARIHGAAGMQAEAEKDLRTAHALVEEASPLKAQLAVLIDTLAPKAAPE
jgi:tetratricopeptide (TPR) repeat protein